MAVAAGLLHDIGMLHVDPQILDPDTALTPRQRRQWHPHPLVSTAMVARHDVYPPRWASTRNAWMAAGTRADWPVTPSAPWAGCRR